MTGNFYTHPCGSYLTKRRCDIAGIWPQICVIPHGSCPFAHTMLPPTWSPTPSHSFYKGGKAQRGQVSGRGHRWISGRVKSRKHFLGPLLGLFPLPEAMSGQVPLKRKIFCKVSYMVPQLWELRVLRENSRRNLCRDRKLEYTKYEVADSSTAGERKPEERKEIEVNSLGTLALSLAVTSLNTCS